MSDNNSDRLCECRICNKYFKDVGNQCPHILYCGHSFCKLDISNIISSGNPVCPVCERKLNFNHYPNKFPPKNSGLLKSLSRELTKQKKSDVPSICNECCSRAATQHCIDCKVDFCDDCCDAAHQLRVHKAHKRCPIAKKPPTDIFCITHDEKLKLFCIEPNCLIPVCVLCASHGDHKNHETKMIDKVLNNQKSALKQKNKQMNIQLADLVKLNSDLIEADDLMLNNEVESSRDIKRAFQQIRDALNSKEDEILKIFNSHVNYCKSDIGNKLTLTAETISTSKVISQEISQGLKTVGLIFLSNIHEYNKLIDGCQHNITNQLTTIELPIALEHKLLMKTLSTIQDISIRFTDKYSKYFGNGCDGDLEVTTPILLDSENVYQFENVIIYPGGEISVEAWNGQKGGKLILKVANRLTIREGGNINVNGKGYHGGIGSSYSTNNEISQQGESIIGKGGMLHTANIGGGGGGGISRKRRREYYDSMIHLGGAGGGYGSTGMIPTSIANSPDEEENDDEILGGASYGDEELGEDGFFMGSGGGGGSCTYCKHYESTGTPNPLDEGRGYAGGAGGGTISIFSRVLQNDGHISSNGAPGMLNMSNSAGTGGGGGSGGAIKLILADIPKFGILSAMGGSGGMSDLFSQYEYEYGPQIAGGAGGNGRIHINVVSKETVDVLENISPQPHITTEVF